MCENPDDDTFAIFEQGIKHTHQCLECKRKFLAHQSGCPVCGKGAKVLSLGSIGNNIDYSAHRGLD